MRQDPTDSYESESLSNRLGGIDLAVLALVAIVCGWRVAILGYVNDDHLFNWLFETAHHPIPFDTGRFTSYLVTWALYKGFAGHPGAFHILVTMLHVLVATELLWLLRSMRISFTASLFAVLLFALFPPYHEAVYWLNAHFYVLAALMLLLSLRLFRTHLAKGGRLSLTGAWLCYFVACGGSEQVWPLCIIFLLMHYFLHISEDAAFALLPVRFPPKMWKSISFPVIAGVAITIYLFCDYMKKAGMYADSRIKVSGGLASVYEIPMNLLTVMRTAVNWPRRHFFYILDGSIRDLPSNVGASFWLFVTSLAVLLGIILVPIVKRLTIEQVRHTSWKPAAFAGFLGLTFFFLPYSPLAVWNPAMVSRLLYIPWIGAGIVLAVLLDRALGISNSKRWRVVLALLLSLGLTIYVGATAISHYSIQSALSRGWAAQQMLFKGLAKSLAGVDTTLKFFFVGDPKLIQTHLNLLMHQSQINTIAYPVTHLLGHRRTELVDASPVRTRVKEYRPGVSVVVQIVTPRSGRPVGEFHLEGRCTGGELIWFGWGGFAEGQSVEVIPHDKILMFGFEDNQFIVYDRIAIVGTSLTPVREYRLPASTYSRGSFRALEMNAP